MTLLRKEIKSAMRIVGEYGVEQVRYTQDVSTGS